jgi:hypothetical protein
VLAVLLVAGLGAAAASLVARPGAAGALVAGALLGPLLPDPAGPAATVLAVLAAAVLALVAGLEVGAPERRAGTRAVRAAAVAAAVLALAGLGVLADPPATAAEALLAAAVTVLLAGGGLAAALRPPWHGRALRPAARPWAASLVLAGVAGAAALAGWAGLTPLAGVAAAGLALGGTPAGAAARRALAPAAPARHRAVAVAPDSPAPVAPAGEAPVSLAALAAPVLLAVAGAAVAPAWPPGARTVALCLAGAAAGVGARAAVGAAAARWRGVLAVLPVSALVVAVALGARQAGLLGEGAYAALLAAVAAALLAARPLDPGRPRPDVPRQGPPAEPDGRLRVEDGVVELVGVPPAEARALLGLRAASLAPGATPGPRLVAWLTAVREPVTWTPALAAELRALLRAGEPAAWELLERLDLLPRYLPELGAVRAGTATRWGRADRPWLQLAALARLAGGDGDRGTAAAWSALERPDDLLLAGLVRAVAGDLQAVSLARRTARRLGLDEAAEETLAVLTGGRADLAAAAVRVDARDEEEVMRLAVALGTPEHARMAYLLAVAEAGAGPEWQGWRRRLLDELLEVVLAAMAEPDLTGRSAEELLGRRRAEVEAALAAAAAPASGGLPWTASLHSPARSAAGTSGLLERAPRRWLLAQPAADSARLLALADPPPGEDDLRIAVAPVPAAGRWRVDVVARDRPGLLASLTGALAGCGLDVVRAEAWSWPNGLIVDSLEATGPPADQEPGGLPARVERAMHHAVAAGPPPPADQASGGPPPGDPEAVAGPVVVRVEASASPWHSLVTVEAPARPGLLHDLLAVVAGSGADVQVARAGSEHGHTTGVLFVTDANGRPLDDAAADTLAARLAAVLTPHPGRAPTGRRRPLPR